MRAAVADQFVDCSIGIFAAAVADYRPAKKHPGKMKKSGEPLTVQLEPTVDILGEVARGKATNLSSVLQPRRKTWRRTREKNLPPRIWI